MPIGNLISLGFLLLGASGTVVLGQEVTVVLVGRVDEYGLGPQVRGKIGVSLGDGSIGGLGYYIKQTNYSTLVLQC